MNAPPVLFALLVVLVAPSCAHRAPDAPVAAASESRPAAPALDVGAPADAGSPTGPAREAWVLYGGRNGIRRAPRETPRCTVESPCRPTDSVAFPVCLPPLAPRAPVLCGVPCPALRLSDCSEEAGCPPGSSCRPRGVGEAVSLAAASDANGDEVCVPPRCRTDADCAGRPRFGCVRGECAVRPCEHDADCAPGGACIPPELRCLGPRGGCRPVTSSPLPAATCYPEPGRCGEHSVEAVP